MRRLALWALLSVPLFGCAAAGTGTRSDAIEPLNRRVFALNNTLDRVLVAPLADAYVAVVPRAGRTLVRNFFSNAGRPGVALNNLAQGKLTDGFEDLGRFVFNSTLGIGGLIDIAGPLGLPLRNEDFGQTLAVWGVGEGPYLELPLLGPNSVRDVLGLPVDVATNALSYVNELNVAPVRGLEIIQRRARLDSAIAIRDEALDPYVFQREAYRQHRAFLIHDGEPPYDPEDELDALEAELDGSGETALENR